MRAGHIDLVTLGCSKNLVDSEHLMRQLQLSGYTVSHDPKRFGGEIAIVNTCGFIGDAKEESIQMILRLGERKKQGRLRYLYVMGCLSQRYKKELEEEIPEVDAFFGKFDTEALLKVLGSRTYGKCLHERCLTTPRHYAYVKIAEGCNRTCSYCAIPLITGSYKSRSIEDIEQEVRYLCSIGVKEFQLIAQDLTFYGRDNYGHCALKELLQRITAIKGVYWVRLHYAYPTQFPYDILPEIRTNPKICKYLDVALQHASTHMLQLMRRGVTYEDTVAFVERLRKEVPGICLRTTLMVGHPGETDEDFECLLRFVKQMHFERMGAFAYSHEEGTYADLHYEDNVPMEVKQQRLDSLMALQQQISLAHNQSLVGKQVEVVVDRKEGDWYVGRTAYDSPEVDTELLVPATRRLRVGAFYQVQVDKAEEFDFYGHIIE